MTLDPAQVLEDAADVLLIHGRCRGFGKQPSTGQFCVLGAIAEVVQPGWDQFDRTAYFHVCDEPEAQAAIEAIDRRLPATDFPSGFVTTRVYDWNDVTEDDDEVRDTLLLAAKDLRGAAVPS